jgi:hypothetical protein
VVLLLVTCSVACGCLWLLVVACGCLWSLVVLLVVACGIACGFLWLFFVGCGVANRFQMLFVVLLMASEEGVEQRREEKDVVVGLELGGMKEVEGEKDAEGVIIIGAEEKDSFVGWEEEKEE